MTELALGPLMGLLVFVVSTAWAQTPVCPVPGDWQFLPEFSDEFNGRRGVPSCVHQACQCTRNVCASERPVAELSPLRVIGGLLAGPV